MKKNEKKTVLAKALTSVADGMLSKAANSRCALIYHQPKQPEEVRKFRKNKRYLIARRNSWIARRNN